jgi:hypothetical protein
MANPMATAARAVLVLAISRDKRQKADFSILLFRGKIFLEKLTRIGDWCFARELFPRRKTELN